jgi:hypothetical protein
MLKNVLEEKIREKAKFNVQCRVEAFTNQLVANCHTLGLDPNAYEVVATFVCRVLKRRVGYRVENEGRLPMYVTNNEIDKLTQEVLSKMDIVQQLLAQVPVVAVDVEGGDADGPTGAGQATE